MTTKQPDFADINAMAMEACDMWQEHLSNLANDPSARAELTRFLEPQRRLFADWAAMMQQGGNYGSKGAQAEPAPAEQEPPASVGDEVPVDEPVAPAPAPETQSRASSGDDPFRVAQLALRMVELEKRVALLELRLAEAAQ